MQRKGFPESYDTGAILRFLAAIKAGQPNVKAPSYSHLVYDVLPNEYTIVDRPDILIFEGINVLQSRDLPAGGKIVPMVSDFFDFSIYIDAEESRIHNWYVDAFHAAARNGVPGSELLLPPLRLDQRGRSAVDRRRPVGRTST